MTTGERPREPTTGRLFLLPDTSRGRGPLCPGWSRAEATDGKAGLVCVTRGALLKHGGHCLPPRNLGDADLMDQEIAQGSALLSKAPQGILRCGQGRGALVHRVPRGTGCRAADPDVGVGGPGLRWCPKVRTARLAAAVASPWWGSPAPLNHRLLGAAHFGVCRVNKTQQRVPLGQGALLKSP